MVNKGPWCHVRTPGPSPNDMGFAAFVTYLQVLIQLKLRSAPERFLWSCGFQHLPSRKSMLVFLIKFHLPSPSHHVSRLREPGPEESRSPQNAQHNIVLMSLRLKEAYNPALLLDFFTVWDIFVLCIFDEIFCKYYLFGEKLSPQHLIPPLPNTKGG